jgi:hypothetical protein
MIFAWTSAWCGQAAAGDDELTSSLQDIGQDLLHPKGHATRAARYFFGFHTAIKPYKYHTSIGSCGYLLRSERGRSHGGQDTVP